MLRVKFVAAFVWVALILVVILQNQNPVDTEFLFMTLTAPQAALLSISTLCGMAVFMLVALRRKVRNGGDPQRVKRSA